MTFSKIAAAGTVSLLALVSAAQAQTQIDWWHAMGGELGEKTEALATAFNAAQSEFVVVPSYRGSYTETMTGANGHAAHRLPHDRFVEVWRKHRG